MAKKNWLKGVAIVLIALLALAGCSGKKNSGGGGSSGSSVPKVGKAASDFTYSLTEDGKGVIIEKYTGKGGAVVIPGEIEGFPVVELELAAFRGETVRGDIGPGYNITSVVIPASVKKIGGTCFHKIEKLTSVTILGSGVEIGSNSFSKAINLSELKFPDGDKVLFPDKDGGFNHFNGCKKLPLAVRAKLTSWGFEEP
ncbi:MAG: leucine-rich repeat domain-containing protein [Treponema sp.]|jgi:hypothetical protein|nr:leucine-rich repeat domain-containing protein [Treponema sp.]